MKYEFRFTIFDLERQPLRFAAALKPGEKDTLLATAFVGIVDETNRVRGHDKGRLAIDEHGQDLLEHVAQEQNNGEDGHGHKQRGENLAN